MNWLWKRENGSNFPLPRFNSPKPDSLLTVKIPVIAKIV